MLYLDIHTHKDKTDEGTLSPRGFAIHPWALDSPAEFHYGENLRLLELLETLPYTSAPRIAVGAMPLEVIGETGIDRARPTPPLLQQSLFERHIRLAEKFGLPLVIHCVRSQGLLLQMREQHPQGIWILHGFSSSTANVRQLRQANIIPSFGAALLDTRKGLVHNALRDIGIDGHFLLETDAANCTIKEVYAAAAKMLNVDLNALMKRQYELWQNIFPHMKLEVPEKNS